MLALLLFAALLDSDAELPDVPFVSPVPELPSAAFADPPASEAAFAPAALAKSRPRPNRRWR